MLRSWMIILAGTLVVLGWWALAFQEDWNHDHTLEPIPLVADSPERQFLLRAVNGDTEAMLALLDQWEKEFSQSLLVKISQFRADLHSFQHIASPEPKRLLPQSFAAAGILLALAPEEWIVALPPELRNQAFLYPTRNLDQIKLDINRYHSEKLFLAKPEIAFIGNYSNPATVEALKNQGMELFVIGALESPEQILHEINRIGQQVGLSEKAQLLARFITLSLNVTDEKLNRLKQLENFPRKILYILHHQLFNIPTPKTLTGQLLSRMQIDDMMTLYCKHCSPHEWFVPADRERILSLDPDALIVASTHPNFLAQAMDRDRALKGLRALQNHQVIQVEEVIQQTPSQLVALAYYDLYLAIEALTIR